MSQVSAKSFVTAAATPTGAVLLASESAQLCAIAQIGQPDVVLQDVAWVQEGIDMNTTKSIKIDSVHELKTIEAMRKVLHRESVEVLIAVHRDNLDQAKRAVDHLI